MCRKCVLDGGLGRFAIGVVTDGRGGFGRYLESRDVLSPEKSGDFGSIFPCWAGRRGSSEALVGVLCHTSARWSGSSSCIL